MGTIGAMKRIRTVIYLDKKEREALNRLSRETGAPVTELVRRAIVGYVAKRKKK